MTKIKLNPAVDLGLVDTTQLNTPISDSTNQSSTVNNTSESLASNYFPGAQPVSAGQTDFDQFRNVNTTPFVYPEDQINTNNQQTQPIVTSLSSSVSNTNDQKADTSKISNILFYVAILIFLIAFGALIFFVLQYFEII
jgi:hypothetical protein